MEGGRTSHRSPVDQSWRPGSRSIEVELTPLVGQDDESLGGGVAGALFLFV